MQSKFWQRTEKAHGPMDRSGIRETSRRRVANSKDERRPKFNAQRRPRRRPSVKDSPRKACDGRKAGEVWLLGKGLGFGYLRYGENSIQAPSSKTLQLRMAWCGDHPVPCSRIPGTWRGGGFWCPGSPGQARSLHGTGPMTFREAPLTGGRPPALLQGWDSGRPCRALYYEYEVRVVPASKPWASPAAAYVRRPVEAVTTWNTCTYQASRSGSCWPLKVHVRLCLSCLPVQYYCTTYTGTRSRIIITPPRSSSSCMTRPCFLPSCRCSPAGQGGMCKLRFAMRPPSKMWVCTHIKHMSTCGPPHVSPGPRRLLHPLIQHRHHPHHPHHPHHTRTLITPTLSGGWVASTRTPLLRFVSTSRII